MKYGIFSEKNHVWYRGIVLGFRTWGIKTLAKPFESKEEAEKHMEEYGLIGVALEINFTVGEAFNNTVKKMAEHEMIYGQSGCEIDKETGESRSLSQDEIEKLRSNGKEIV